MERYEEVDRKVAPKREALQRADQQYQGLMGELRKKQEALRGVQEELAGLQAELDTVKKEKLELEQTVSILGYSSVFQWMFLKQRAGTKKMCFSVVFQFSSASSGKREAEARRQTDVMGT